MKILYIVPWSVPFDKTNLQDIVNTQFGYYTLKEKNVDITWLTHNRNGGFYKLCKVIRMPQLNQIFSQLSVIGKERDYDVIYVGRYRGSRRGEDVGVLQSQFLAHHAEQRLVDEFIL